jgi:hypothetical protein
VKVTATNQAGTDREAIEITKANARCNPDLGKCFGPFTD